MKKYWHITGWALGAIFLFIFLNYFFDLKTTKQLLKSSKISYICLSVIFYLITLSARASKWTYILKIKDHVRWKSGYHTIMVSNFFSFIFPIRAGELLKLYIIKKVSSISYSSSVSATLNDRFSHLLIIFVFLFFTPIAGFKFSGWSSKFVIFFILFVVMLVVFYFYGVRFLDRTEMGFHALRAFFIKSEPKYHNPSGNRIIKFFRETLEKSNIYSFTKGNLIIILLLSFIIVSLDGLCFFFFLKAFNLSISWFQSTLAACLLSLMFILPTPPGQVGTAEMYPLLIFSWGLGLSSAAISSAAVLWHLLTSCVLVILGIYSTVALGIGFGDLLQRTRKREIGIEEKFDT